MKQEEIFAALMDAAKKMDRATLEAFIKLAEREVEHK